MRIVSLITDPPVVVAILQHLELPHTPWIASGQVLSPLLGIDVQPFGQGIDPDRGHFILIVDHPGRRPSVGAAAQSAQSQLPGFTAPAGSPRIASGSGEARIGGFEEFFEEGPRREPTARRRPRLADYSMAEKPKNSSV